VAPRDVPLELLTGAQQYLNLQQQSLPPGQELEAAWGDFYEYCTGKIRTFLRCGGVAQEDSMDCVQEVWRELLVRLPAFQLDAQRGRFNTWLFSIVRSKAADLHRDRANGGGRASADILPTVPDLHPSPERVLETKELVSLLWEQLSERLSECNLQVLWLRLVEERSVEDVAAHLGLRHEQVWYRYRRARRVLEEIGSALLCDEGSPR
jgi:RNA polymerase sigma factor (sigma-70 family)